MDDGVLMDILSRAVGPERARAAFPAFFLPPSVSIRLNPFKVNFDTCGHGGSDHSDASLRSAPPLAPLRSAPVPPLVPRVALSSLATASMTEGPEPSGAAAGLRPYSAAAERGWTRPGPDGTPAQTDEIVSLARLEENRIMAKAERDLLNFILTYGTTTLEFQSDSEFYTEAEEDRETVFDFIDQALAGDETGFANSAYRATYEAYSKEYYDGFSQEEIVKHLLDGPDRTIAFVTAQLSTDERYDLSVKNLRDAMMSKVSWLTKFVPKAILVFQGCRLEEREYSLKEDLGKAQTVADTSRELEIMQELVSLRKAIKAVKVRLGREK